MTQKSAKDERYLLSSDNSAIYDAINKTGGPREAVRRDVCVGDVEVRDGSNGSKRVASQKRDGNEGHERECKSHGAKVEDAEERRGEEVSLKYQNLSYIPVYRIAY